MSVRVTVPEDCDFPCCPQVPDCGPPGSIGENEYQSSISKAQYLAIYRGGTWAVSATVNYDVRWSGGPDQPANNTGTGTGSASQTHSNSCGGGSMFCDVIGTLTIENPPNPPNNFPDNNYGSVTFGWRLAKDGSNYYLIVDLRINEANGNPIANKTGGTSSPTGLDSAVTYSSYPLARAWIPPGSGNTTHSENTTWDVEVTFTATP